jgi:Domain of unknown function (DUF4286)
MFLYNVTIKLDWSIHEEWLKWMKEKHIPQVMATGCFSDYTLVRLLEIDETEGPTYATLYKVESKSDYNRYIAIHATALRQEGLDRWGSLFIAFRTIMEIVN